MKSRPGLVMGLDIRLAVDMEKTHVFEPGAEALNRTIGVTSVAR